MISWSRVVRSMAGVSWTDVPASAVRVRRPVAIRGKPVMAAKLGNFPSSAHPSPLPVKDTEKTVSGMDSEQSATGGRGKVAEESSTDFLPSMSPTAGGVSGGVSRHEALLPTEGFGEVSLETTSSMEGIFTETPAFLDSRCLPVHTLGPPSISKPLGANVETPLRPVPLTARLCGATPQSTPAMDPPLLQLSSLLLAASVPSSSAVSRGHWGACPLAVPANAFRLQLSLPELLSTLPQVSMETSEPLSTTPVIETSDGSEVCTNVLRPDPTGCQTDDRTHEPTRRRVAAAFPRRFPSTTFKVGAPPVFDRDLPSTAECTGDRAKMAVDPPPPPSCAHGTSKEAAFEGTDEASVSRESFPTPKAVPRSRPSLSTQGKVEMEDSSVNVHRRKNVQRGKRPRSRGDTGTQVDFPAESPSPPMEDTSFLFAMDVEGLLLEKEAKRRRTRKCKTLSAYSTSSCESSEEELDTRTARKKRKELSRKNRGKKGVKPKKPVPNAFVSVRIPSPQISEKIGEVQKGMLLSDKKLKSALVSLDKLHLTLMVLRLEGEEAVERAKDALQASVEGLRAQPGLLSDPVVLEFSGVSSFGKGVVFAGIKGGEGRERLSRIAETVCSVFDSHGFPTTDTRPFNPHLTIAKVSRAGRKGPKRIQEETYSDFRDASIGREVVAGLELLSMTEPAAEDGYYHCFGRCGFSD